MEQIIVSKVDDVFIIKKNQDSDFFATTNDSFIISKFNLASLINFLLRREFISPKVLEGILSEYRE